MPFPFLTCVLIFIIILFLTRRKSTRLEQERNDNYLNKEILANSTRKQNISALNYITIPLETFPLNIEKDDTLLSFEAILNELTDKRILNLTGISNTDLKMQYGLANLEALSEYDSNFTTLARTIVDYAARLIELNHIPEAITVLNFGIECRSDIYSNYNLLATLYLQQDQTDKIPHLIEVAKGLNSLRKASILENLATF